MLQVDTQRAGSGLIRMNLCYKKQVWTPFLLIKVSRVRAPGGASEVLGFANTCGLWGFFLSVKEAVPAGQPDS